MNNINAVDCTTKYRGIWFSLNGDTLYHEKRWKCFFSDSIGCSGAITSY